MPLSSMTGFARKSVDIPGFHAGCEIKSVNGKGLDVRVRTPAMLDGFDLEVRKAASARFQRGSISINLMLDPIAGADALRIDEARLLHLLEALRDIARDHDLASPGLEALIGLPGMVDARAPEPSDEDRARIEAALLSLLSDTLDALAEARLREGREIESLLAAQLERIGRLVEEAGALEAVQLQTIRGRLSAQIESLLDKKGLDDDRLEQEIALLAIRHDIREEIDRLGAHVSEARRLIASGEAIGRKLDFLAQEFNREANTLCSKSADTALTRLGLDLKSAIDQLREQCQNVE